MTFKYDPFGRRIYKSSSSGTSIFDSNGNTTSKTDSTGTTNYTWDFENRLTSVTLPGTGGTVSFSYDPFGRRIKKVSSAGTSIFAYDDVNLIEETNATGAVVARYAQDRRIDEPLAVLRSATTSYYQADGLGSVTSLSNTSGAIANSYTYDSFGKQTASTGSLVNPFRYTARESDTETGLYYYRARYYDQQSGRFVQEDLLRLPDGFNSYGYALNSPTNAFDPFGLCPWQVRQRPLAGKGGKFIKDWGDPPPSHKYFYNSVTGQSIGLGFKNLPWYKPGAAVPGDWEKKENPRTNPDDTKTGDVPDDICDCVDKKAKNPGPPPTYCLLGKPHLGQPTCTNCWNWVLSVLQECRAAKNNSQNH